MNINSLNILKVEGNLLRKTMERGRGYSRLNLVHWYNETKDLHFQGMDLFISVIFLVQRKMVEED